MADDTEKPTVDVNYVKSAAFREVLSEGIIGGPTPNGQLWMAFYNERFPIPRIVRYQLRSSDDGQGVEVDGSGPSTVLEGRSGIIRNIEFGVSLSIDTAETLHKWLGSQLASMRGDKA
ncbi:hypothetical protein MKK58_26105 [Methylobacterium sp. J-078]|uniref:hypothetical protein n=1 Tax=Methylobacterium sp. J-078 TaxID=2836657 RepID=UPI001FB995B5|nr:hypothetical protein [Methylobacterium sp. J-078]MCJ2047985.1 hypothetical protein [Methylobacterium sp. J-078]